MNNLKKFKWVSVLIIMCFILEQSVLPYSYAKSRKSSGADAFGMLAGALVLYKTPISGQSLMRAGLDYLAITQSPKVFKSLGLNQSWQNIGGSALAGGLIGGMNSVSLDHHTGMMNILKDGMNRINPYNWQKNAVLMDATKWAAAGAIQHYGYKNNWDDKVFGGATMLASKIGATVVETGLSNYGNLGGWVIEKKGEFSNNIKWANNLDYRIHKVSFEEDQYNPYSAGNKFKALALEGVSLASADLAGRYLGLEKTPEFSRAVGTAMSDMTRSIGSDSFAKGAYRALGTAALSGVTNLALQQVTGDMGNLGPYAGAITNLGLTSVIRARMSGVPMAKDVWGDKPDPSIDGQMFMAGVTQATGSLLSGGIGTLDAKGNIYYNATPDASYAAEMIDFSRAANKQTSSAGKYNGANGSGGVINAIVNKYFENINSQANANIIGIMDDRLDKTLKYVKGADGKYVRQRRAADENGNKIIVEQAQLWNPNEFKEVQLPKEEPKELKTTEIIKDLRVASADDKFVPQDIQSALTAQMDALKVAESSKPVLVETPSGDTVFKQPKEVMPTDKVLAAPQAAPVTIDSEKNSGAVNENTENQVLKQPEGVLPSDNTTLNVSSQTATPEVKANTDIEALKKEFIEANYPSLVKQIATNLNLGLVINYGKDERIAMKMKGEKPKVFWNNEWFSPGSLSGYLIGNGEAEGTYNFPITEGTSKENFIEKNKPSIMKRIIAGLNLGLIYNYSDNEILALQMQGKNPFFFTRHWRAEGTATGKLFGEKGERYITGAKLWFDRPAPQWVTAPPAQKPPVENLPPAEKPVVEQAKPPALAETKKPEIMGPPNPPDYQKLKEKAQENALKKESNKKIGSQNKTKLISPEKAEAFGIFVYEYFGGNEQKVTEQLGPCPYKDKTWKEILTDRKPGKGFWKAVEKFQADHSIPPTKNIGPRTTAAIAKYKNEKATAAATAPSTGSNASEGKKDDGKKAVDMTAIQKAYAAKTKEEKFTAADSKTIIKFDSGNKSYVATVDENNKIIDGQEIGDFRFDGYAVVDKSGKDKVLIGSRTPDKFGYNTVLEIDRENGMVRKLEDGTLHSLLDTQYQPDKKRYSPEDITNKESLQEMRPLTTTEKINCYIAGGLDSVGKIVFGAPIDLFTGGKLGVRSFYDAKLKNNWKYIQEGVPVSPSNNDNSGNQADSWEGKPVEKSFKDPTTEITTLQLKGDKPLQSRIVSLDKTGKPITDVVVDKTIYSLGWDLKSGGEPTINLKNETKGAWNTNATAKAPDMSVDLTTGKMRESISKETKQTVPNAQLQRQIQGVSAIRPYNYMSMVFGERKNNKK